MKVLMVYPFEFPGLDRWEGSRSRLFSFCQGLTEKGVEVHVLGKRDPSFRGGSFRGVPVHHLMEVADSSGGRVASALLVAPRVMQLAREHDFQIVHAHLPIAAAGVALAKPFVRPRTLFDTHDWYKLHDELYFNFPRLPAALSGAVDGLEGALARRHDGVAVTTPLLSRAGGRKRGVYVVPNAVDAEHFRPSRSRFREEHFGSRPVVLFLGSVSQHQGLWELIGAMNGVAREVRDVRLLVVGGGAVGEAKAHASELGVADRVVFTGPGRIPYDQVPDLINAADVGVSPKQPLPRWHEYAQPLKVLEYMACGKPFVVTPLKEQRRLAEESGGGVVAGGFGAEEIAVAVARVLRGRAEASGEAGRRYVAAHHSQRGVVDTLLGAYAGVEGRDRASRVRPRMV